MNEHIQRLLDQRLLLKKEKIWEDISTRVSSIYPPIKKHITAMEFIPASPTLMNANTKGERIGTLSSCFPMKIEDSIEGIFNALTECAIVTKYGGGIGVNFSPLRSSSEGVSGIGDRKSSGPLPFISIYNEMLSGISQGGSRRGAGMSQLDIYHPNILDFINAKVDISEITNFNFSIRIPDSFYTRLKSAPNEKHQVVCKDGKIIKLDITVKELWDLIIERAWKTGEPGIFNSDIAYNQCAVTNLDDMVLSNPCAEFVNIPYTSCALGSIDLAKLITVGGSFDWDKFENLVVSGYRFINATLDKNVYPTKKIKDTTLQVRAIGLGYMGLAHLFYKLKIPYNSDNAKKLSADIMLYLTLRSMQESVEIAKKKGSYPAYDEKLFFKANARLFKRKKVHNIDVAKLVNDIKKYGIHNSATTSIAPTGTLSFLAETSSGIEPVFALSYSKKIKIGTVDNTDEYDTVYISDPIFSEYITNNFDEKTCHEIQKHVIENYGSCQKCKEISDEMKKVFVVAADLTPNEHLDILEIGAANISLSVSKTINLPKETSKSEIGKVYLSAHERKIIGVTVYRDGSREGILVHGGEKIISREAPKRPKELPCHIYTITVKGVKWKVFVGLFNDYPFEVFAGKIDGFDIPNNIENGTLTRIKAGTYQFAHDDQILIKNIVEIFQNSEEEALTRLISTNLRHGTPIDFIIQQLEKSHGAITDFNKSIIRAFKRYLKDGVSTNLICHECGNKVIYFDGCKKCTNPECGAMFC